jgi:hypothetical protein
MPPFFFCRYYSTGDTFVNKWISAILDFSSGCALPTAVFFAAKKGR